MKYYINNDPKNFKAFKRFLGTLGSIPEHLLREHYDNVAYYIQNRTVDFIGRRHITDLDEVVEFNPLVLDKEIIIPEGLEIDLENSDLSAGIIKLKDKVISYEGVMDELSKTNDTLYWIGDIGYIHKSQDPLLKTTPNASFSKKQLKKLLAINKLMNVAKYLNGDWKADFEIPNQTKYHIMLHRDEIHINDGYHNNYGTPSFKTKELAEKAIEILGEDTIRLALSSDW